MARRHRQDAHRWAVTMVAVSGVRHSQAHRVTNAARLLSSPLAISDDNPKRSSSRVRRFAQWGCPMSCVRRGVLLRLGQLINPFGNGHLDVSRERFFVMRRVKKIIPITDLWTINM